EPGGPGDPDSPLRRLFLMTEEPVATIGEPPTSSAATMPGEQLSTAGSDLNAVGSGPAPTDGGAQIDVAEFAPLTPNGAAGDSAGLDLLLDVNLQVSVELGRTRMTIGEVLALRSGSVIELDKLAGEPADILVNGT